MIFNNTFSLASKSKINLLFIPILIGIIATSCFFASESFERTKYIREYFDHEHSLACEKLICQSDEHTHSNLCLDCSLSRYSFHEHSSSCYCSKTEHTHDSACYMKVCKYSAYENAEKYADANISFAAPITMLIICAVLIALYFWISRGTDEVSTQIYADMEYNADNFFNEDSIIWLSKLKLWIKIIFYLEIFGSAVWGVLDGIGKISPIGAELGNFAFLVWVGAGVIVAFVSKNISMLALQFLKNVNTMREKMEELITTEETEEQNTELEQEETEN